MVTKQDVDAAANNWRNWQTVFEYAGSLQTNTLLEYKKFHKFLREYSVGRTIERGKREAFRDWCRSQNSSLRLLLEDQTGMQLENQLVELTKKFGARIKKPEHKRFDIPRTPRSLLSKIASFLAPGNFIAWDNYACKGVKIEMRPTKRKAFPDYVAYRADVETLMSGRLGDQVRAACAGEYPSPHAAVGDRFHLRVLDVYLMRRGGRGSKPARKREGCYKV